MSALLAVPNPFRLTWSQRFREACAAEMGVSALLHGALAFVLATAMAALDVNEREQIAREDVATMRDYLRAAAERGDGEEGAPEAAMQAGGEALSSGRPGLSDSRLLRRGPAPPKGASPGRRDDPTTAREHELRAAQTFGVIGLLAASAPPADVWGDAPVGERRIGAAWGSAMDGSVGGLLLAGAGEGGGGRGEGIAIGAIGTLGHCTGGGCGSGNGQGAASGHGGLRGAHRIGTPSIRCGGDEKGSVLGAVRTGCGTSVHGRLPPEVIQRVVRQNHGRFRLCFEAALRDEPSLSGRVETKFVIGRDGSVTTASEGTSDLPPAVTACVVRAFASLSFPQPEGGIVTVVYPLVFSIE